MTYIIYGSTNALPELQYATGFIAPDPVACIRTADGRTLLLVNDMEAGRALTQSRGCEVVSAGMRGWSKECPSVDALLVRLLQESNVTSVDAHPSLPLFLVRKLEAANIEVNICAQGPWSTARLVKRPDEIAAIANMQRAAHAAARRIGDIIENAAVDADGCLLHEGAILSSERARDIVRAELLAHGGMDFEGTIVAGGSQAADPHESGHGPLRTGEWIVCDIFPRSLDTGYWGDLTRTFMNGTPSPERKKLYDTVAEAQRMAKSMVRPGVRGEDVHKAVCDYFAAQGYATGVDADGRAYGYFHGTGHGVGLEIHESPSLSRRACVLEAGNVVTVEPGLYYPAIGGVRIEDTVLVTDDGCIEIEKK